MSGESPRLPTINMSHIQCNEFLIHFIFKNYVWRNIPIKATLTFLTVFCFAAQNVTVEEILSSYKQACQKLNCKPIPKVLKQIQVRLNIIQTHSWHTTDRLSLGSTQQPRGGQPSNSKTFGRHPKILLWGQTKFFSKNYILKVFVFVRKTLQRPVNVVLGHGVILHCMTLDKRCDGIL